LPVCAVFNAGRSENCDRDLSEKYGKWQQLKKADIVTVEYLCKHTIKKDIVLRGFLPAVSEQIKSELKAKAVIPPQIPDINAPASCWNWQNSAWTPAMWMM